MTEGTLRLYARDVPEQPRRLIDRLLRRNKRTQIMAVWPSGRVEKIAQEGSLHR